MPTVRMTAPPAAASAQPSKPANAQPAKADSKIVATPPKVAPSAPKNVAPTPAASAPAHDEAGLVDELLSGLDDSFKAIIEDDATAAPAEGKSTDADRMAVLELFYEVAINHLRPVRNFMTELRLGDVRREWVAIARPATVAILDAARKIGVPELERRLAAFEATFSELENTEGTTISGTLRNQFLERYQRLQELMPRAFNFAAGRDQNESLLTLALLQQVPDVGRVTIDRLYKAGLTALEIFFLATTDDLAATTGIRSVLAQRIVDKFQGFRKQVQASRASHDADFAKLDKLLIDLKEQHQAYETAARRGDAEKARGLRLARQSLWLEVTVVLAQLGQGELVTQLEKISFEHKLRELTAFAQKAR